MTIHNNDITKVNILMDVRNDFMKSVLLGKVLLACNANAHVVPLYIIHGHAASLCSSILKNKNFANIFWYKTIRENNNFNKCTQNNGLNCNEKTQVKKTQTKSVSNVKIML